MDSKASPLTDESYWTTLWDGQQHKVRHLRWAYVANRQLAKLFHRALANFNHPTLIELGCADSLWLPYLAKNYDGECYGIDFSELGCQLAQRNLALAGVEGTILCKDIFTYTKTHIADFDFVYSMGLIEHFTSPQAVLEEMYSLLKPGGTMLTIIPNLRGMYTPIAPNCESKSSCYTPKYFSNNTCRVVAECWISRYRIWIHRRSFKVERS